MATTATERMLIRMLTENTGAAMMDSGDAYGRNWQRNQNRAFKNEPAAVLDNKYQRDGENYQPDVTLNVFHWLADCVDYDAKMDRRYQAFARKRRGDEYEMSIMEMFTDEFLPEKGHDVGGLYGESTPFDVNTYNGEDLLSQTLQYRYFTCDGDSYVLLQIHGGCDVRGGYTGARAFRLYDNSDTAIMDNARATIIAQPPEHSKQQPDMIDPERRVEPDVWDTDDAYHWYKDGACGCGAGRQLETYIVSYNPEHRGDGEHVYIDGDGIAYSPLNGQPLEPSF